jgi:hypothetical protein
MSEFDFDSAVIDEITSAFLRQGCVLLHSFVEVGALSELQRVLGTLYDEIKDPHIYAHDFTRRGLPPPHMYLFRDKHEALLRAVYQQCSFEVYWGTHSRRIDAGTMMGGQAAQTWMPPLGPHLDAFYHELSFTVNFWVPFMACGADAPSLGVVRLDPVNAAAYSGYDGRTGPAEPGRWNFGYFKPAMWNMAFGDRDALAQFYSTFANRIWLPIYRLGDAMMISNWTLHFTYATPEMPLRRRENIELRFIGKAQLPEILSVHGIGDPVPRSGVGFGSFSNG